MSCVLSVPYASVTASGRLIRLADVRVLVDSRLDAELCETGARG